MLWGIVPVLCGVVSGASAGTSHRDSVSMFRDHVVSSEGGVEIVADDGRRFRVVSPLSWRAAAESGSMVELGGSVGRHGVKSMYALGKGDVVERRGDEEQPGHTKTRFSIRKAINEGSFGEAYIAYTVTAQGQNKDPVVLKRLKDPSNDRQRQSFEGEFKTQKAIGANVEYIARVLSMFETTAGDLFIEMSYYNGGDLRGAMKRLRSCPEQDRNAAAKNILRHVATALLGLKKMWFVHKDVKPANIFIKTNSDAPDDCKMWEGFLGDFGLVEQIPQEARQTPPGSKYPHCRTAGTPGFLPPEAKSGCYAPVESYDLFSFGAVINELVRHAGVTDTDIHGLGDKILFGCKNFLHEDEKRPQNSPFPDTLVFHLCEERNKPKGRPLHAPLDALAHFGQAPGDLQTLLNRYSAVPAGPPPDYHDDEDEGEDRQDRRQNLVSATRDETNFAMTFLDSATTSGLLAEYINYVHRAAVIGKEAYTGGSGDFLQNWHEAVGHREEGRKVLGAAETKLPKLAEALAKLRASGGNRKVCNKKRSIAGDVVYIEREVVYTKEIFEFLRTCPERAARVHPWDPVPKFSGECGDDEGYENRRREVFAMGRGTVRRGREEDARYQQYQHMLHQYVELPAEAEENKPIFNLQKSLFNNNAGITEFQYAAEGGKFWFPRAFEHGKTRFTRHEDSDVAKRFKAAGAPFIGGGSGSAADFAWCSSIVSVLTREREGNMVQTRRRLLMGNAEEKDQVAKKWASLTQAMGMVHAATLVASGHHSFLEVFLGYMVFDEADVFGFAGAGFIDPRNGPNGPMGGKGPGLSEGYVSFMNALKAWSRKHNNKEAVEEFQGLLPEAFDAGASKIESKEESPDAKGGYLTASDFAGPNLAGKLGGVSKAAMTRIEALLSPKKAPAIKDNDLESCMMAFAHFVAHGMPGYVYIKGGFLRDVVIRGEDPVRRALNNKEVDMDVMIGEPEHTLSVLAQIKTWAARNGLTMNGTPERLFASFVPLLVVSLRCPGNNHEKRRELPVELVDGTAAMNGLVPDFVGNGLVLYSANEKAERREVRLGTMSAQSKNCWLAQGSPPVRDVIVQVAKHELHAFTDRAGFDLDGNVDPDPRKWSDKAKTRAIKFMTRPQWIVLTTRGERVSMKVHRGRDGEEVYLFTDKIMAECQEATKLKAEAVVRKIIAKAVDDNFRGQFFEYRGKFCQGHSECGAVDMSVLTKYAKAKVAGAAAVNRLKYACRPWGRALTEYPELKHHVSRFTDRRIQERAAEIVREHNEEVKHGHKVRAGQV